MNLTTSTITSRDVINYALEQQCFYDHRASPYRLCDQLRQLKATAEPTEADGLIRQPGLIARPLPRPKVPTEPLANYEDYDVTTDLDVQSYYIFPFLQRTKQLRLPPETMDTGYDMKKEMKQYLNDIQLANTCNILTQWLPLSHVSNRSDEGLEFPSTVSRWQSLALRELEAVETASFELGIALMQEDNMLEKTCRPEQVRGIFLLGNQPRAHFEPMSCPLSPASELDEAFVPSPEVMIIDITSDPSSPINTTVSELEKNIENGFVESEPVAPSTMPSSPPTAKVVFLGSASTRPSDLKLDVPLLASSPGYAMVSNYLTANLASDFINSDRTCKSPTQQGGFFEEAFQAVLEDKLYQTNRQLEQERLNPSESLLRLPIPAADFHIPDPEWYGLTDPKKQFTWLQQADTSIFHLPCFEGLHRLEASLKWTPIPHGSGRVSLTETVIQMGPNSRELLSLQLPQLCSRNYVNIRRGVSVLQVLVDEELEPDITSNKMVELAAPERNLDIISSTTNTTNKSLATPSLDDLLGSRRQSLRRKVDNEAETLLLGADDPSAAGSLLTSFIQLRHPKKLKTTSSSSQARATSTRIPQTNDAHAPPNAEEDILKKLQEAPAPMVDLPMEACRYIVSMSLSRKILSCIEKSWQQVELIDRDFSQYNTIAWSPGSAQRKELISSLAFEADISLCPAAGLIVTTILKVKQKPLPGSTTLTPFRERVKTVSGKYEVLFILVSETNPLGEYVGSPTASDIAGYADFVRFTTSLRAGISTFLISGSEVTASKWALSILSRYSSQARQFGQFLDFRDGTWELFLRRAGLNISAAQVIAGLLVSEYRELGLAKFMGMNAEQRVSKYGQIMGGGRVLNNVSRVLDQEWV
ncbi:hypothetical protein DER45DRAFT_221911 [Fusarium avenaceum]|nr:hypothetical protein DER45DRAFT_221911 [Fusarium avenaceum]